MDQMTATDASSPRRKAYSYLRFSTPEQSKGDSYRRQMSMALAYAAKHNLDLDQELTFHDVGVSAYRGQNADAGRLAYFVEAVRSGQVPQGSLLLVEQLDRVSRLTPLRALDVLRGITSEGVGVVTLNDEKVYTKESLEGLPMDLIISILTFTRANEESATKARRLRAAWEAKRAKLSSKTPITAKLPAWLRLGQDRTVIEEVPERVAVVRRIFDQAASGVGQHRIAAMLNEEGIEPWGEGGRKGKFWHRSYISKVLSNPAVLGTFRPHVLAFDGHHKTRRALDPVEGYFPAIITEELFQEVQALRQTRGAPQRGRHANSPVTNILAGLAVCSKCGGTMTRVQKGKRSRPSYVCTTAKSGAGCEYRSLRCDLVEGVLYQVLPERLQALDGATGKAAGLDEQVEGAQLRVDALVERCEVLLDQLLESPSSVMRNRLRREEANLEEARSALGVLQERVEAASGLTVQARVDVALTALEETRDDPQPGRVNLALRRIFSKAVIDPTEGTIDLEWHHGGSCSLKVPKFTKQPAPGWQWQEEEDDHDDEDRTEGR